VKLAALGRLRRALLAAGAARGAAPRGHMPRGRPAVNPGAIYFVFITIHLTDE
jgi:hypothetical protein